MAKSTTRLDVEERRKHQRLSLSIPIFVRGTDESGKQFLEFGTALNISAGGILVAVRRTPPPSADLTLEIPVAPLPAADHLVRRSERSLKARLVRVKHEERVHIMAMKFLRALKPE